MLLRRGLLELASKSSHTTTATGLFPHYSRKQISTFFSTVRNKASSSSNPKAKEKVSAADGDIGFVGKAFALSCSVVTMYYIELYDLDGMEFKTIVPIVEKVKGMFPITIGKFTLSYNDKGTKFSSRASEELQESEKDGCS